MATLRKTPLYDRHKRLGAKMTSFAGFDMPVRYSGIREEHQAVRNSAGLFDVSHMGEFLLHGPKALELVQRLTTNDASRLDPGQAQYTVMCNAKGGIRDDLLVYRVGDKEFMLVVNASNIDKNLEWIHSNNSEGAMIDDISGRTALLALQGPGSPRLLGRIAELDVESIGSYTFLRGSVAGQPGVIVSATGYTGEKGFELYVDLEKADPGTIWDELTGSGEPVIPVGLGARDTLRLEMGYALYGNELTEETTPVEAGLKWLVKPQKGTFIGDGPILEQLEKGVTRTLTGFVVNDTRQIPRAGYALCDETGKEIGNVTSGSQSITLGRGIGMGYLPPDKSREGETVHISIRKSLAEAVIRKPPFIGR